MRVIDARKRAFAVAGCPSRGRPDGRLAQKTLGSFRQNARWVRFAKMDLALVSRAQRSTKWCAAGPGPFQSEAVPDQRCTATLRAAPRPGHAMASDAFVACGGTRWLVRSLYFPVFLQIRNLPSPVSRSQAHTPPRSRGAFSAPEVCTFASLTPNRGVGGAPIRHPHIPTSPQVAPERIKRLSFLSCAPLTPPLTSPESIA